MSLKALLQDDANNQEDYQPVSNDPLNRRTYRRVNFLQPGQSLETDSARTLWLIAGILAAIYFFKDKK